MISLCLINRILFPKRLRINWVVLFCFLSIQHIFSQGTWLQKTNFPGPGRLSAFGFAIGNKGYVGTGWTGSLVYDDCWEYDPATNAWTQKANYAGGPMYFGMGFAIGNKGYAGIGYTGTNDFWEYDPVTNGWVQKASLPGTSRSTTGAFVINGKGYVATGYDGTSLQDLWQYDPSSNSWTAKAFFPPSGRNDIDRLPFVINNKAYLGMGLPNSTNDIWEYDAITDVWTQKANFPSTGRFGATGFSVCNYGYAGMGQAGSAQSDFYMYDPRATQQELQ